MEFAGDAERVGLVGTAVGDHPDLESMLGRLTDQGRRVGISSMRPDQITPRVASLLGRPPASLAARSTDVPFGTRTDTPSISRLTVSFAVTGGVP